MGRITGIVAAGALLALGFSAAALADETHAVAARAHLSYRPAPSDGTFEGVITVVEQQLAPPAALDAEEAGAQPSPPPVRYLVYTRTSASSGPSGTGARAARPGRQAAQPPA